MGPIALFDKSFWKASIRTKRSGSTTSSWRTSVRYSTLRPRVTLRREFVARDPRGIGQQDRLQVS